MRRPSPTLERFIAGATLTVLFLMMASVFAPDFTQANPGDVPAAPATPPPSTDVHAGLASLGSILDDRYRIEIYADRDEPLYSIYDRLDGRTLGVLLHADEVEEWFPDLPLPDMQFGDGSMLMLAEPSDADLLRR
jgi:hypothetical protein